ncbi:putative homoserine kinase type II (protein kinase fold) [Thioflavicoccus mobilis 8321]|uniref:Putative homoserine kinase type II (Protein kinase fold) n=1 Tax=Thioflavicoccus mobilis 8321 TaxID=765912 RepID=L0GVG8_9GAMM|nr:aminoglycoside phosphotransferase family protein [Thioflavicoccus mobilis]AGA89365.1 putative homoserine kinase type II (protein kinase fold) [Thioflavicoccus mobilis 8321]
MTPAPDTELAAALAERFPLAAPIVAVQPFGNGLINRTYLVTTTGPAYILQRLNGRVFPQPAKILENLDRLGRHLHGRRTGLRLPALIPADTAELGVWDGGGNLWRMIEYVANARTRPCLETPAQAASVGTVLARFHRLCADLDPAQLAVTLPGFHVTPGYERRLREVLAHLEAKDRSTEVGAALQFIEARTDLIGVLGAARAEGRLPLRVVHGDPKLDNILFDEAGERAIALIDLDTVQPGLIHHDIGDCLRSCCNRGGESGRDADFDLTLCRPLLAAYAEEAAGLLAEAEIALLFDALRLIPLELGLRFLTDHLEGDRYFRVRARGENLRKAQVQLALVADIERQSDEIHQIIAKAFGGG